MAAPPADANTFSFGGAFFGFPVAQGRRIPAQYAPEDLREALVQRHPEVLSGLFTACCAGRDFTLRSATTVKLSLQLSTCHYQQPNAVLQALRSWCGMPQSAPQPTPALTRRLTQLQDALRVRGSLPTSISIYVDSAEKLVHFTSDFTALVGEHGSSVREFTIDSLGAYYRDADSSVYTHFLFQVARLMPRLTSLSVCWCPCSYLPLTTQLPHVTQLRLIINHVPHSLACTIATYVPQLTLLGVVTQSAYLHPPAQSISWSRILTHTSHTLTQLRTSSPLDNTLVNLILRYAPCVRHVRVACVELRTDTAEHSQRQWGVQRLEISLAMNVRNMVGLPRSNTVEGERMVVECEKDVTIQATSEQGLDPSLVERLSEWSFKAPRVIIEPHRGLVVSDRPAALRAVLTQLASLHALGVPVEVRGYWGEEEVAVQHAVEAAGVLLPHLTLSRVAIEP